MTLKLKLHTTPEQAAHMHTVAVLCGSVAAYFKPIIDRILVYHEGSAPHFTFGEISVAADKLNKSSNIYRTMPQAYIADVARMEFEAALQRRDGQTVAPPPFGFGGALPQRHDLVWRRCPTSDRVGLVRVYKKGWLWVTSDTLAPLPEAITALRFVEEEEAGERVWYAVVQAGVLDPQADADREDDED